MRPRFAGAARAAWAVLFVLLLSASAGAQEPVVYRVTFPAPEHHYAEIEVTFSGVPSAPLEARMSRSSPGRYAIHEFAKNVFELRAYDGKGAELAPTRPNPYHWDVAGHDGTVRILDKTFGRTVDGTYLAIDESHAHMGLLPFDRAIAGPAGWGPR
jgi:predicted metalloprotease with PDZ domain